MIKSAGVSSETFAPDNSDEAYERYAIERDYQHHKAFFTGKKFSPEVTEIILEKILAEEEAYLDTHQDILGMLSLGSWLFGKKHLTPALRLLKKDLQQEIIFYRYELNNCKLGIAEKIQNNETYIDSVEDLKLRMLHKFFFPKAEKYMEDVSQAIKYANANPNSERPTKFDLSRIKEIPIGVLLPQKTESHGRQRVMVCCPLHSEHTPSFTWYTETNTFHCYGCGKGGDVISLYQSLRRLNFKGAIAELSQLL